MQIPGNIWSEAWQSAKPVPARRQKRLFDDTKEAEKVTNLGSTVMLNKKTRQDVQNNKSKSLDEVNILLVLIYKYFWFFFRKILSENFIYSMLESRKECTTLSGIVYRIIISLKLFLLTHCYRCYISCLQWSQLMLWFIYCPCCYIHL